MAPEFQALNVRFDALDHRHPPRPPRQSESMESDDSRRAVDELDEVRLNGGLLSRLPADFEFPQAGVYDLWIKWNIRDTVRKIPPLKKLRSKDYSFLDSKPKPGGGKRRVARKIFCDMKYICGLIETAAIEKGMDPSDGVPANIRLIYDEVSPSVFASVKLGGRTTQFHWATIVDKMRKRDKREKKAAAIGAGVEG